MALTVFKTGGTLTKGPVGSIPIRLRHTTAYRRGGHALAPGQGDGGRGPTARDDQPADRRGRGCRARRPAACDAPTCRPSTPPRWTATRWRGRAPGQVTGRVMAGPAAPGEVGPGQAVEIGTGAPVPAWHRGRRARTSRPRARAPEIRGPFEPGRHVRRRGEDCRKGAKVLPVGHGRSPPWCQGLAASLGQDALPRAPAAAASPSWSPGTSSPPPAFPARAGCATPSARSCRGWSLGRGSDRPAVPGRGPGFAAGRRHRGGRRGRRRGRVRLDLDRAPPTTCARSAGGGADARPERGLPAGHPQLLARLPTAAGRRAARKPVRGAGRGADPPRAGPRRMTGRDGGHGEWAEAGRARHGASGRHAHRRRAPGRRTDGPGRPRQARPVAGRGPGRRTGRGAATEAV